MKSLREYFESETLDDLIFYRSMHRFVGDDFKLLCDVIQEKIDAEDGVTFKEAAEAAAPSLPPTLRSEQPPVLSPEEVALDQEKHEQPAMGNGTGEFVAQEFVKDITFDNNRGPRIKFSLPGRSA